MIDPVRWWDMVVVISQMSLVDWHASTPLKAPPTRHHHHLRRTSWPTWQVRSSLHRQNLSSADRASHLSQPDTVSQRDYPHPGVPASAAIGAGLSAADGGSTKIENVNPMIKINGDKRAVVSVYLGRRAGRDVIPLITWSTEFVTSH